MMQAQHNKKGKIDNYGKSRKTRKCKMVNPDEGIVDAVWMGIDCLRARDLMVLKDLFRTNREIQDQFIACKIEKIQKAEDNFLNSSL